MLIALSICTLSSGATILVSNLQAAALPRELKVPPHSPDSTFDFGGGFQRAQCRQLNVDA